MASRKPNVRTVHLLGSNNNGRKSDSVSKARKPEQGNNLSQDDAPES